MADLIFKQDSDLEIDIDTTPVALVAGNIYRADTTTPTGTDPDPTDALKTVDFIEHPVADGTVNGEFFQINQQGPNAVKLTGQFSLDPAGVYQNATGSRVTYTWNQANTYWDISNVNAMLGGSTGGGDVTTEQFTAAVSSLQAEDATKLAITTHDTAVAALEAKDDEKLDITTHDASVLTLNTDIQSRLSIVDHANSVANLQATDAQKLDLTEYIVEAVTADPTGNAPSAAHKFLAYDTTANMWYRKSTATNLYEPVPSAAGIDINLSIHTEAGNAPTVGTIPAVVSSQTTRDENDLARVTFDDEIVWYTKTATTTWLESNRLALAGVSSDVELSSTPLSGAAGAGKKFGVTRTPTGQTILYDVDGGNYREILNSTWMMRQWSATETPAPVQNDIRFKNGVAWKRTTSGLASDDPESGDGGPAAAWEIAHDNRAIWIMSTAAARDDLLNTYATQRCWLIDGTKWKYNGAVWGPTTNNFLAPRPVFYVGDVSEADFNNIHAANLGIRGVEYKQLSI